MQEITAVQVVHLANLLLAMVLSRMTANASMKLKGKSVELESRKELVLPVEIEQALRAKGKLRIKYLSAYNDETTTRVIEPYDISVTKESTYIHAFCHLRKERCTFRLDRILEFKTVNS